MEKTSNQYEDYLKVHEYAKNYTKDNRSNASDIIKSFNYFLNNYTIFLVYGHYQINNYSIRKFLSLYSDKKVRSKINQYNYYPSVLNSLHHITEKINFLLSDYSYDDVYNECACALLYMAERYNDTKPSFHTYVKRCYHYRLKINIDKLTASSKFIIDLDTFEQLKTRRKSKDPIYKDEYLEIEEMVDKEFNINNTSLSYKDDDYSIYDDRHINSNWINGITCSEHFKSLNNFERNILVENYLNKKSDKEIALNYGLARETINRKKRNAVNKLKNILIKENSYNK